MSAETVRHARAIKRNRDAKYRDANRARKMSQ